MVKKLALFVEGQTEAIFARRLIEEIGGVNGIQFEEVESRGSGTLSLSGESPTRDFFVLIANCHNDERVKSAVLEHRPSLISRGYSMIIGLRDLFPSPMADLEKVKSRLRCRIPTAGARTEIVLAVTEVEAWFLQDHTHFARIHLGLDVNSFKTQFGFDPQQDCAETIPNPAQTLHSIYSSVGLAYKKKKNHVNRTADAIDFASLYFSDPLKIPHFRMFSSLIDEFLVSTA